MSDDRAALGGLAGVILTTEPGRFEAMRDFYRDTLGLPPRTQKPEFINFEWGDVRLTVTTHSDVSGSSRDPLRVLVNLAVDDIGAAHARLVERGIDFIRPPGQEDFGGWIATFADPDGNTLQLLQESPEPAPPA